jgi:hypothetical protein
LTRALLLKPKLVYHALVAKEIRPF